MQEHDVRAFYTDRRTRGMTDAMIAHELEASGWSLADARVAVEECGKSYVPQSTSGFSQTAEYIEYDVPKEYHQQNRSRAIIGICIFIVSAVGICYFDYVENGLSFSVLIIPALFSVIFSYFLWVASSRKHIRRIRFDHHGHTITDPLGKTRPWTLYQSFSIGSIGNQSGSGHTGQALSIPELPMISLQPRPTRWQVDEPRAEFIPYPPQHQDSIRVFLQGMLPVRQVPTLTSPEMQRRIIGTSIAILVPAVIAAIVFIISLTL